MELANKDIFVQLWPRKLIIFLSIIELLVIIFMILTEIGNMIASFWLTNVFAGIWCGVLLLIYDISLFINGCCLPGPKSALASLIIGFISFLATIVLIVFDIIFIIQPSTCLMTSSCLQNSVSTTVFSYSLQQSFLQQFSTWPSLSVYTQAQAKYLFQYIQLATGILCFFFYILYVIIYYIYVNQAKRCEEDNLLSERLSSIEIIPPRAASPVARRLSLSKRTSAKPRSTSISLPRQQDHSPTSSEQQHEKQLISPLKDSSVQNPQTKRKKVSPKPDIQT